MEHNKTMEPPDSRNEDQVLSPTAPAPIRPLTTSRRYRPIVPQWIGLLLRNRLAAIGIIILLIFTLMAVFAPLLTPYDPATIAALPVQPPSADHWFGTTRQGQDVFAQVVFGARLSLFVGAATGALTTAIAIVVGMTAGYVGGWLDDVLNVIVNVFLVIPGLPLLIVLVAYIPFKGPTAIIIVISITGWAYGARVLRSQTLSLRSRDFVQAALISGESTWRLIIGEVMPNMLGLIIFNFIGAFVYAILFEAGLEFLGLGDANTVSWGTILYWAQTNSALETGAWWHFLFPGLAIALTATACIFINYGIDTVSNPRLRGVMQPKPRQLAGAKPSAEKQATL